MTVTEPPYRLAVGSLCSGYEGLGMGLELGLGHNLPVEHAWFVENDPAPSKILARHYPDVPNHGDLKALDFGDMEPVDILTAGYPCQPFSDAGLRKGADDPRHLWPYVADAIRALRPGFVLLENVRGHVRRGSDSVVADLAELGYDARWGLVRASDAGAPHRRERWFLAAEDADSAARGERWLAAPGQAQGGWTRTNAGGRGGAPSPDPKSDRWHEGRPEPARVVGRPDAAELGGSAAADAGGERRNWWPDLEGTRRKAPQRSQTSGDAGDSDSPRPDSAADSDSRGREEHPQCDGGPDRPRLEAPQRADALGRVLDWGVYEFAIRRWEHITGRPAPWATEPRGRGGAERLSPRFVEWMMGLPDGWVTDCDLSPNEQLKALGNGVVPQQAALAVSVLCHNSMNVEAVA